MVGLYQQAIEYYEFVKDPKYIDFNKRLQRVLTRPDVRSVLVANAPKPKARKQRNHRMTVVEATNPTLDPDTGRPELLLEHPLQLTLNRTVTRMIDTNESRVKDTTQKVKEHIATQEVGLQKRLEARKFRLLLKAQQIKPVLTGTTPLDAPLPITARGGLPQESDICGGIPHERLDIEGNIEKLMEDSYYEQKSATEAIKAKYHPQLSELELQQTTAPNDLIQMVINQMKATLEEELNLEISRLKRKRHEAIVEMRLRY